MAGNKNTLIWFDVSAAVTKAQSHELRELVHSLQPECLVSGRVGHDAGDYGSLGDNQIPAGRVRGDWETPATLNDTWGFKHYDHNWKPVEYLVRLMVQCASKGVNYLAGAKDLTLAMEEPDRQAELGATVCGVRFSPVVAG